MSVARKTIAAEREILDRYDKQEKLQNRRVSLMDKRNSAPTDFNNDLNGPV